MFKKINKIDNHFVRFASATLDNKLSLINQKTNDTNAKLDATKKDTSIALTNASILLLAI